MKLWILAILGITIALMLRDLTYLLAAKFWKHVAQPVWNMVGPKPGGKLWQAKRMIGL